MPSENTLNFFDSFLFFGLDQYWRSTAHFTVKDIAFIMAASELSAADGPLMRDCFLVESATLW